MSLQNLFDDIVTHARSQRKQSNADNNSGFIGCAYRGPKGLKCFIGALIPDELYSADFEETDFDGPLAMSPQLQVYFVEKYKMDLEDIRNYGMELQRIHDETSVELWDGEFDGFAKEYKLDYVPEMIERVK